MKLIVSTNPVFLETVNTALTAQAELPVGLGYSVGAVYPKFDGTGYWYMIEKAVNISELVRLSDLATNYMNGIDLPGNVTVVEVTDLVAGGYTEGAPKSK